MAQNSVVQPVEEERKSPNPIHWQGNLGVVALFNDSSIGDPINPTNRVFRQGMGF